jgi:Delta3-Delta2-enoyl-CoA isomerase
VLNDTDIRSSVPTIAAVNGHCFAGGFILAMACDYRVMTDGSKRNAWMCMNEVSFNVISCPHLLRVLSPQVHFGAMWPLSMASIVRAKVGDGRVQRKIALEGHRFPPQEALSAGLVDHIVDGNTEAVLAKAVWLANSVGPIAKEGVWGIIKVRYLSELIRQRQQKAHCVGIRDR